MKNSFIIYADAYDSIRTLADEECGQLLRAIFLYHRGETLPELTPVVGMAFSFLRRAFDANASKYKDKCEKAKAAAKVRWDANVCERIKRNAFNADTDTDSDSDTEKKNIPTTPKTKPSGHEPTREPEQPKDPRPNKCPPDKWQEYLQWSRGFHRDKQNQLGKMAPMAEAKVLEGAKAIDNLIRVRGFSETDVIAVLGWSIEDQFWSTNLRSVSSLLKKSANGDIKYINVLASMNRDIERRVERNMAGNG